MNFAFRTDASLQIGTGHVMRCLTLADALRERNLEIVFLCRPHDGHMIEAIRDRGYEVFELSEADGNHDEELAHSNWLGTTQSVDASQCVEALESRQIDWLIVDHYALDCRWEGQLRASTKQLMVIDDLADRKHDCDLLLDQNLVSGLDTRYSGLIPSYCVTLLGPEYALLQKQYSKLHPRTPPRLGEIKRILVYFGGSDQYNLTSLTVRTFLSMRRSDIVLDVVVSINNHNIKELRENSQTNPNIIFHEALPSLAPLMLRADIAIGAGGAASWERCCLGLPALVITIAENQRAIASELHNKRLIHWLGHHDTVDEQLLCSTLDSVLNNNLAISWSRKCKELVDGNGAIRVASIILLNKETKLKVRHATLEDEQMLLLWANDQAVRKNSFNSTKITRRNHRKWFYERLRNPNICKIYIAETEAGFPIGQVRFDKVKGVWEIDYSLVSIARRKKLGIKLLQSALQALYHTAKGTLIMGRVKYDNNPSHRIFADLGFAPKPTLGGGIDYSYML